MRGTAPIGSLHGKLLILLRLVIATMGQGQAQRISFTLSQLIAPSTDFLDVFSLCSLIPHHVLLTSISIVLCL
jgi:hypothetical protein